jgi:hypothetical protein
MKRLMLETSRQIINSVRGAVAGLALAAVAADTVAVFCRRKILQ